MGHKKSPVARFYIKVTSSYFDVREDQWRHSQNKIIGDAVIPTNHWTVGLMTSRTELKLATLLFQGLTNSPIRNPKKR